MVPKLLFGAIVCLALLQITYGAKYGDKCLSTKNCTFNRSFCRNEICICKSGYDSYKQCYDTGCEYKCGQIVVMLEKCSIDVDCIIPHSYCQNAVCHCELGYVFDGKVCKQTGRFSSYAIAGIVIALLLVIIFIASAIRTRTIKRRAEDDLRHLGISRSNLAGQTFPRNSSISSFDRIFNLPTSENGQEELAQPITYSDYPPKYSPLPPLPVYTISDNCTDLPPAYDELDRQSQPS